MRKNYKLIVDRYEMEQNFKYFERLRMELLIKAGKVIRKHWMNYQVFDKQLRRVICDRAKMKRLAIERAIKAAEETIVLPEKKVVHRVPRHRFSKDGKVSKLGYMTKESIIN